LILLSLSIRTLAISYPVARGTFPTATNIRDEVAGYCIDSIAVAHGFIRDVRGRITVFDAPRAGAGQRQRTFANDINNVGTTVGYYIDAKRLHYGFVREPNGALTRLDGPGAGAGLSRPMMMGHPELLSGQGTLATSVNDEGTITGYFIDAKDVRHGFLRDKLGTFLVFDARGGGDTVPESINDSGEVTGTYDDPPTVVNNIHFHSYSSGAVQGFLRDANGKMTLFDLPPVDNAPWESPHPQTVSDDGAVVGWYGRNRDVFIRDAHGAYTTFSIPEPPISPLGSIGQEEITACYLGAQGARRGLSRNANGTSSGFNPASLAPGRFQGVICAAITAGGRVVGYYPDKNCKHHGFIRAAQGALTSFDAPCEGNAVAITSVSPFVAGITKSITIKGRHFGGYPSSTVPAEGRVIIDSKRPGLGCGEFPAVVRWTDTEIVVAGAGWPSNGTCSFTVRDHVNIGVGNAQTGAGPAWHELTVGSSSQDFTSSPPSMLIRANQIRTLSAGQERPALTITGGAMTGDSHTVNVRVPFVGCNSDGQTGPVAAPRGVAKLLPISPAEASALAFYSTGGSSGVLAPRGWYCFGTYGSSGSTLIVAPQPLKADDLFAPHWRGNTGPSVQVSFSSGETSGRFDVAKVIARVFPAHKSFVEGIIKDEMGSPSDFPFGPYPNDKLTAKGARIVEFQTPPHSEGLGTTPSLQANAYPISGVAILQSEAPDLVMLRLRLPPEMNNLAAPIIRGVERENAGSLSHR
jgi:hypothetical protein